MFPLPLTHSSVVISFSRVLFHVRQERVHTGNCDSFVSSTHSGRTAMSQCARPGASSDAAFVLKQFLRISSKKYTNENRRLDVVFGYFFVSGSVSICTKVLHPRSQTASRAQSHSNTRPPSLSTVFLMFPRADSSPRIPPSCRGTS